MKKVVSLQWKGIETPVEFQGEGDTEIEAWGNLLDKIYDFGRRIETELNALRDVAWKNYDDARE
jgi:hypothetical protein